MVKFGAVILLATILVLAISSCDSIASRRYRRQAAAGAETAVATTSASSSNAIATLTQLILPTFRALVHAPMKMFQELLAEIREFMATHNFSEMFDTTFIRSLIQRLPERAGRYWQSFIELESECIQRTLCDVADFTTHQVPQWVKQILLVYFTTFNENIYFEAINNGLIAHNCQAKFPSCDPNSFLSKLSNNVSDSIHTTVAPIKDALNELVNVTVSTLLPDDNEAVTRAPVPSNSEVNDDDDLNLINGDIDDRLKPLSTNDEQNEPTNTTKNESNEQNDPVQPMVLNQNSFLPQNFEPSQFQPIPVMLQTGPVQAAPMVMFANPSQLQIRTPSSSSNHQQFFHSAANMRQSKEESLIES